MSSVASRYGRSSESEPLKAEEAGRETSRSTAKILVLGGNGFVGSHVCKEALAQGFSVSSLSRSGKPSTRESWAESVEWHKGNLLEPESLRDAMSDATAVVSCVGGFGSPSHMRTLNGTANVNAVQVASEQGVQRFAYVSAASFGVIDYFLQGYYDGQRVTEAAISSRFPNGDHLASRGVIALPGTRFLTTEQQQQRWIIRPSQRRNPQAPTSVSTRALLDGSISLQFQGYAAIPPPEPIEVNEDDVEQTQEILGVLYEEEGEPLLVQRLHPRAVIPQRKSEGAAGYDLAVNNHYTILAGERLVVSTGIAIAIPEGFYGRIAPKSGISVEKGFIIGAGVIDWDYRECAGQIKLHHLWNLLIGLRRKLCNHRHVRWSIYHAGFSGHPNENMVAKPCDSMHRNLSSLIVAIIGGTAGSGRLSLRNVCATTNLSAEYSDRCSDLNLNSAFFLLKNVLGKSSSIIHGIS